MIEYYKWQGHPLNEKENNVGFYIIQPSRFTTGGFAGPDGKYQYLGWFFTNGKCHFSDRTNHSAAPDELEEIKLPLTDDDWRGMIKDIFEIDWKVEL